MNFTKKHAGMLQLIFAMILSGTIGYFVIESDQSPINVVFFRCFIGSACLIVHA